MKAELDEYVVAGKLTQEQADLILRYVQEWQTGKQDGMCGGKQRGGKGQMRGNGQQGQPPQMGGNGQFGSQMPGNGQFGGQMPQMGGQMMPDANSGATPQMPGNHR